VTLAHFLAYRHPFPIGQLVPLDSYITSYIFALGSLVALIIEAARTSEKSVDIELTTPQYVSEDPELHVRCRENLKSQIFYTHNLMYICILFLNMSEINRTHNRNELI
jgi:hypothetical protein